MPPPLLCRTEPNQRQPDLGDSPYRLRDGYKFSAWALLLLLAIAAGLLIVERAENRRFAENQRRSVVQQLSTIRARLEGDLNAELLLSRSIITEITIDGGITRERFYRIAESFWKSRRHIRNLGLAKGTVLTYLYPEEGNERAIGLDYKDTPSQWPAVKRVIEGRETVIAGPLKLVQGGVAIIGRSPIFVQNSVSGKDEYFGMLSVALDTPSLFAAAGLGDKGSPLDISIRGKDGMGTSGDVFYGSGTLFDDDPVLMDVSLPEGRWQMAATPVGGWRHTSPHTIHYRAMALIVAAVVLYLLFVQQREMANRKRAEEEREKVISDLRVALSEVKQLSGLLPICSHCKKVRDSEGYWNQIEAYISQHSDAEFSHSICEDCAKELYPNLKMHKR